MPVCYNCVRVRMQHVVPEMFPKLRRIASLFQPRVNIINANQIDCDYDDASLLGRGGFGLVYRGKLNNEDVAIKKLLTNTELTLEHAQALYDEAETWRCVLAAETHPHPHVITV